MEIKINKERIKKIIMQEIKDKYGNSDDILYLLKDDKSLNKTIKNAVEKKIKYEYNEIGDIVIDNLLNR
jgi:hypothetical protein